MSHVTRDSARGRTRRPTGLSPSLAGRSRPLRFGIVLPCRGPTTPAVQARPVWAGPRSLAATKGIAVAFSSSGYLDVSVPRVCSLRLRSGWRTLRPVGLPHSEILGSQLVCSSPRLIAAYHVLHRLPVPRHPPCALTRLISVSRCDSSTPQHTHSSVVKELNCTGARD